jgi:hypothetical protein
LNFSPQINLAGYDYRIRLFGVASIVSSQLKTSLAGYLHVIGRVYFPVDKRIGMEESLANKRGLGKIIFRQEKKLLYLCSVFK